MRLAVLAVTACVLALSYACASSEPGDTPQLSPTDQRARDRARTMERQGRVCDAGNREGRDLVACREACGLGHSNSCGWLGDAHAFGLGVAVDPQRALERYREACKGGSGLGCEGVARLTGEASFYTEARTVYRVHCSQRHAASCSRLARLYAEGLGGKVAREVAITYWQHACTLGVESDCKRVR